MGAKLWARAVVGCAGALAAVSSSACSSADQSIDKLEKPERALEPAPIPIDAMVAGPVVPIADYAARMIAELDAIAPGKPWRFDAKSGELSNGDALFSLDSLYREWLALPVTRRADGIRRVAASLVSDDPSEDRVLDHVRAKLRPLVRAGLFFDPLDAHPRDLVSIPLGESTAVGIAIDYPDRLTIVEAHRLADLQLDAAQALAIATANLEAQSFAFEAIAPGVWGARTGDSYDSARLLLVDKIRALHLAGSPVALIPNRDELLLAGADDPNALLAIAELADAAADRPRPIHTIALCLAPTGATWTECEPHVTPAVKARFHALAVAGRASLYAEQRGPLAMLVGDTQLVAELKLHAHGDDAGTPVESYTTWIKGVSTLLPHADHVVFVDVRDGTGAGTTQLGAVPWARVMKICGAHLVPDGRSPPRWATGEWWPSPADLTRLAPVDEYFAP